MARASVTEDIESAGFGTLTERFRDKVSKLKDYKMKQEAQITVQYPTGFLNFDFMNGTIINIRMPDNTYKQQYSVGIADGSMCMFIGRSGCGKTTLAMQIGGNIANQYKTSAVFHDDIEGGISSTRKQMLLGFSDEDFAKKYVCRDAGITAENFYERIRTIYELELEDRSTYEYNTGLLDEFGRKVYKLEPTIYILDSIALLMPEQYTEEEKLSGSMSSTSAAKTNSMIFKRIIPMLKSANIILIMINHINQRIEINPYSHKKSQVSYLKQDETLPGGNTIVYLSNLLIRFDDNLKLKSEETLGISGSMVDLTLVKSRNNKAGMTCTVVLNQDIGFDPELSLFVTIKQAGLIAGTGAYLYLKNYPDEKFAQRDFKNKLYSSPDFQKAFIDLCVDHLKGMLNESMRQQTEVQEQSTNSVNLRMNILSQINNTQ